MKPGTLVAKKVREAIHRCHAVVVLITTASLNSVYVQQEVGIAHECGKPLVPIVEKGIDTRNLGVLQGVEYLELDLTQPAETLAKITASLQPLVLNQLKARSGYSIYAGRDWSNPRPVHCRRAVLTGRRTRLTTGGVYPNRSFDLEEPEL